MPVMSVARADPQNITDNSSAMGVPILTDRPSKFILSYCRNIHFHAALAASAHTNPGGRQLEDRLTACQSDVPIAGLQASVLPAPECPLCVKSGHNRPPN